MNRVLASIRGALRRSISETEAFATFAFFSHSCVVAPQPLTGLDGIVARHYTGLGRPLRTSEGMPVIQSKASNDGPVSPRDHAFVP
jgi:hypothetical protein